MRSRSEHLIAHVVLTVCALSVLMPVLAILNAALHQPGEMVTGLSFPTSLTLDTFVHAWNVGNFSRYMVSSAIVTVSVLVIVTVLSVLGGYALGTMRFRGANVLSYVFLFGLMIPFEAIVIPLYYNLRDIGLTDTYWALILPESALQLSFGIYWMRSFFLAVPRELIEAARVDGARTLRTLVSVLIPIARPAITTMMVLLFMFSWNEFLLPLVMVDSSDATRTAPLGLANFQGRYGTDIPSLAAGSLLVALPVLVLYVFLNRRFIQGVLSGAIKE